MHGNSLNKLIREYSCLKLTLGYCTYCKKEIAEQFTAQTGYKVRKKRINETEICGPCRMKK